MSNSKFLTPAKAARGLGSAKEGYDHWWGQRLTSIAMVPLSFWFVYSMVGLINSAMRLSRSWEELL